MAEKLPLWKETSGTERVEREKCFFEEAESRDQETAGKRGDILL